MILADTSVWIEHLRSLNPALSDLLARREVLAHPFVLGEIAMGHLRQRLLILKEVSELPQASRAADSEVMRFIEREALFGRGIGYVDVHLLAAVRLTAGASLWTYDKRLHQVAIELGIAML